MKATFFFLTFLFSLTSFADNSCNERIVRNFLQSKTGKTFLGALNDELKAKTLKFLDEKLRIANDNVTITHNNVEDIVKQYTSLVAKPYFSIAFNDPNEGSVIENQASGVLISKQYIAQTDIYANITNDICRISVELDAGTLWNSQSGQFLKVDEVYRGQILNSRIISLPRVVKSYDLEVND